jgi:hypothetical protein
MKKPTITQLPNRRYRDSHGVFVTVGRVEFNRVTFAIGAIRFSVQQPVKRFMQEFTEVHQ